MTVGSARSLKILLLTQNTDDTSAWLELLSSLSDEELRRYGQIVADQRRLEWQYGWAQMICAIASVLALGWFARECMMYGLSWRGASILGLAAALGYWPYRKAFVRRLWAKHCKAVAREEAVRQARQGR